MRSDAKLQAPSKTEQSPHLLNEPSRLCFLACINHSYLFFSEVLDLPPSVERMAKTISTRPKENKGHCLASVQGLLKEGASGMKASLPPFVFRWLALTLGLHAALAKLETCSGFLFLLFDVRIETPESFSVFMMFFLFIFILNNKYIYFQLQTLHQVARRHLLVWLALTKFSSSL